MYPVYIFLSMVKVEERIISNQIPFETVESCTLLMQHLTPLRVVFIIFSEIYYLRVCFSSA